MRVYVLEAFVLKNWCVCVRVYVLEAFVLKNSPLPLFATAWGLGFILSHRVGRPPLYFEESRCQGRPGWGELKRESTPTSITKPEHRLTEVQQKNVNGP